MATFDSDHILQDWKDRGRWPQIHGKIGWCATEYLTTPNVLDLCCAFGLLADRIAKTVPCVKKVVGVDGSLQSIAKAKAAGVPVTIHHMVIFNDTVHQLYDLIKEEQITAIVARRAFPELFDQDHEFGRCFSKSVRNLGVQEILIEGRIDSANAKSTLKTLDAEIALFADDYEVWGRAFNCAYLRAKP